MDYATREERASQFAALNAQVGATLDYVHSLQIDIAQLNAQLSELAERETVRA
jgi:hypothetical protein